MRMNHSRWFVAIIISALIPLWVSGCSTIFHLPASEPLNSVSLLEEAKRYAKGFDEEAYATVILLEVAKAQAAAGNREEGLRTFDDVIEMNRSMKMHLAKLGKYMKLNQKNFANDAEIQKIQQDHIVMKQAYAFLDIARALDQARFHDKANDLLKAAVRTAAAGADQSIYGARYELFAKVAVEYVRHGNEEALANIKSMLLKIAESLSGPDRAVYEIFARDYIDLHIAAALLDIGNAVEAKKVVQQIAQRIESANVIPSELFNLRDVAYLQVRMGESQEALSTLDSLLKARRQVRFGIQYDIEWYNIVDVYNLAAYLAEAGDTDTAETTFRKAVQLNNEVCASRLRQKLSGDFYIDEGLCPESNSLRMQGRTLARLGHLDAALEAEDAILEEYVQGQAYSYIINALLKLGDYDRALRLVRDKRKQMQDPNTLLRKIAVALALNGQIDRALDVTQMISSDEHAFERGIALRTIAMVWTQRDIARVQSDGSKRSTVRSLVNRQSFPVEKAYVLLGIADGLLPSTAVGVVPESVTQCSTIRDQLLVAPRIAASNVSQGFCSDSWLLPRRD